MKVFFWKFEFLNDTFYLIIEHSAYFIDLPRFDEIFQNFQTDHTEELEELCHAPNHINESGGESGGEYWLSHAHAQNGLSHPVSAQDQDTNKAGADREPSEETTNHAVIVDNIVVI